MSSIAIYPGSFNPLHVGHLEILKQAVTIFDKVILLHAINPKKLDVPNIGRYEMLEIINKQLRSYLTIKFEKVIIDETLDPLYKYCEENEIHHIVRGIRGQKDIDTELANRHYNMVLANELAGGNLYTCFLGTDNPYVSSTAIRELARIFDEDTYVRVVHKDLGLTNSDDQDIKFIKKLWKAYQ